MRAAAGEHEALAAKVQERAAEHEALLKKLEVTRARGCCTSRGNTLVEARSLSATLFVQPSRAAQAADEALRASEARAGDLTEANQRLQEHVKDLESRKRPPLYQKKQEASRSRWRPRRMRRPGSERVSPSHGCGATFVRVRRRSCARRPRRRRWPRRARWSSRP